MSTEKRTMPYVRLGKSGLKVSRIILGCATYGSSEYWDWVLGEEEGIAHIKAAYDAGINTFDTSDAYSNGLSEVILGKAIKQHKLPRDEIVVMTKVFGVVGRTLDVQLTGLTIDNVKADGEGYVNQYGLSRKHIFAAVKHSLERLQLDYIDVYQCHRFDRDTPIEETMQALHDVVKAGYVRYIGMSACWAYQFHQMQNYAITHNLTPFISMQNHYNLIYREEEREMMPTLKIFGVGSIPFSPLARGVVCRPFGQQTLRQQTEKAQKALYGDNPGVEEIVGRVEGIAKARGISMAQVSLAWMLSNELVAAPIVGTSSLDKLKELVEAVHIKLTDDEIKSLNEPYKPVAVVSHV